jgi:hypothetical protein
MYCWKCCPLLIIHMYHTLRFHLSHHTILLVKCIYIVEVNINYFICIFLCIGNLGWFWVTCLCPTQFSSYYYCMLSTRTYIRNTAKQYYICNLKSLKMRSVLSNIYSRTLVIIYILSNAESIWWRLLQTGIMHTFFLIDIYVFIELFHFQEIEPLLRIRIVIIYHFITIKDGICKFDYFSTGLT